MLGGACVTLNNSPLPLLAASPGQINAQVPPTLAVGRYPLVVRSTDGAGCVGLGHGDRREIRSGDLRGRAGSAIFHKDGTRVDKAHPANRDEPLTIYATGLGTTTGGG